MVHFNSRGEMIITDSLPNGLEEKDFLIEQAGRQTGKLYELTEVVPNPNVYFEHDATAVRFRFRETDA